MARPLWFVQLLKKTLPNARIIAKMTRIPILGKLIDHMLFENDDIIYLPKDPVVSKSIQVNQAIDTPIEIALPSQIVHHFIEKANFHWIMNFCICRDSNECEDYPRHLGCLFMGEAARGINPQLGRPVTKEEAHEHVRKCREAGLIHLIGRNKLDAMWLNVKPGNQLLTVCNCCPCCCLWRIIPDLTPDIGKKFAKMPGVNIEITSDCVGCGTCVESDLCFVDAIHVVNGRAVIDKECMGCGRCIEICPNNAIRLTLENKQYVQNSVKQISSLVDVD